MRADPDYSAYVVARWAPAIRTLVVLGVPEDRAAALADAAFGRLLPDWGRLRREGDVDVELGRLLLDGWAHDRSDDLAAREPARVPAGRLLTQELEEQLVLLGRLTDGLAGCEETTRLAVALRHLGELDAVQVAEVLAVPAAEVGRRLADAAHALDLGPLDPACHHAAGAIDVPPPSVERVVAAVAARRRRQWLGGGAAVAVVALVAGVAFAATKPDVPPSPAFGRVDVTPVANPVGVPWWLDGTLHLAHGTAEVDDVVQLADPGLGVGYADSRGNVAWVSDDGERRRIGRMDPDTVLLAQAQGGRLAWLEPAGGDLVVWSAATRRVELRRSRTDGLALVGWDRDSLYVHRGDHDERIVFSGEGESTVSTVTPPEGLEGSRLVDVASGVELRTQDGRLSTTLPFFSVTSAIPGVGGGLSVDGSWVLAVDADGVPAAYDARDGSPQGPWYDPAWTAVTASFTGDGRVVWVVDEHNGGFGLVDCQVREEVNRAFDPNAQRCDPVLDVGAVPVLAGVRTGPA